MTVLVTGGAGYIGSHVVLALREAGFSAVVLDDLRAGRREAVPAEVPFEVGDVADRALLDRLAKAYRFEAVLHFAASAQVEESVRRPLHYYANNTEGTRALIDACCASGIDTVVFSSTAAVYGQPRDVPVSEDAPTAPINPYGRSKLAAEWILRDAAAAHGLRHVVLRYFNVAGADPAGRAGPSRTSRSQLIRSAAEVAVGRRPTLAVFGTDYPTADGTCVRDFIHVSDLARAHVAALRHLRAGGASATLNCGYGTGFSVRDVIAAVERATGRPLPVVDRPRRPGDAACVIADAGRLRGLLDWTPGRADLGLIVADTLAFERRASGA